jgi:hypothetical protein
MVIHCNFQVSAADTRSRRVRAAVYFYLGNGSKMPALLQGIYATTDGQAAISEITAVTYNVTTWPDFRLYMPVNGLNRAQDCFGTVQIQDADTNRVLATAQTPTFYRN